MAMADALGQQTVDFSVLVKQAAEASFTNLKELCETSSDLPDLERKIGLLKYILKTQQRLLRLLALSKWCRQIPLVERCQQLAGTLCNHDTSFTQAADFLFYLHETLQQACAPAYDIPTAAEVLLTGGYKRLPKCIEDLGMQPLLAGEEKEVTLQKLDTMLRSRLLDISLPREITDITVIGGRVIFRVAGEFEVHLTLGYRGNMSHWRILKLNILVGEPSGPLQFTEPQQFLLGDDLERRMAASNDPLRLLYSILHQFCSALVMDTLFRQIKVLQRGRWKEAIKYEKIAESGGTTAVGIGPGAQGANALGVDGDAEPGATTGKTRGSPGLKIVYWLELQKGENSPSLRIEQSSDQQIICSHWPSVIDPLTESEADFVLDQSCINVEKLLLQAIACNVHTRLLDVQRVLKGGISWWADSDIVLRHSIPADLEIPNEEDIGSGEAGEEALCVRAFGITYMTLGISIRNGRFLLSCPSTSLDAPVIKEMEDALNLGTVPPSEVFSNLRTKCFLQFLASIGRSLDLKVYETGTISLKLPIESPRLGADMLVMGFPNCGETFFLSLQLDINFTPLFTLLEAHPKSYTNVSTLTSNPLSIFRLMKIDTNSIPVLREDTVSSLIDQYGLEGKFPSRRAVLKGPDYDGGRDRAANFRGGSRVVTGAINTLEGVQTGFSPQVERSMGGERGLGSPSAATPRGVPMSPAAVHSPSNLQGSASPHQYGGFALNGSPSLLNPSMASTAFPQGRSSVGVNSYEDANHRVARLGLVNGASNLNVSTASPIRSPVDVRNPTLHRMSPGSVRSPLHASGDQELAQTKSPLNLGDNVASPIDLDDDISKLIDSISSKTTGLQPGRSGHFAMSDPGTPSQHTRPGTQRNLPLPRNAPVNARPFGPKGVPVLGSQLVHTAGQPPRANSPGWKPALPASEFATDTSPVAQEWTDLENSSKPVRAGVLSLEHTAPVQGVTEKCMVRPHKQKRPIAELFSSLSSMPAAVVGRPKRRRTELGINQSSVSAGFSSPTSTSALESFGRVTYADIIGASNQGKLPSAAYRDVLLQVVRRCWLCIKHAQLTRQMDAQKIPFVNEVGLREPSTVLRFRLPGTIPTGDSRTREFSADDSYGWQQMSLCLGKPGSKGWYAQVTDMHFRWLWELQKQHGGVTGTSGVQFASPPQDDAHMQCTYDGVMLKYPTVQEDSISKLVTDLERLWRTRAFAIGIRKLLEGKAEGGKLTKANGENSKSKRPGTGERSEGGEKKWEVMRRAFRVEAIGFTSVSFTYSGSMPSHGYTGVMARFVVEWGGNHRGCTVHSPEQLWPHTKYLEDYINGGEVELLLDAIRVTAGPLHALAAAIRPARMAIPSASPNVSVPSASPGAVPVSKPATTMSPLSGSFAGAGVTTSATGQTRPLNSGSTPGITISGNRSGAMVSAQGGAITPGPAKSPGPGLVPSSLMPTDVSVLLRSPYWVCIVYRRQFAIDMRCFAGDQVWLQPAPPPRIGGSAVGGSLPCPQFRTFVMDHVSSGMNSTENVGGGIAPVLGPVQPSLSGAANRGSNSPAGGSRIGIQGAVAVNRVVNNGGNVSGVSQGGPLVAGSIVSSPSGRGLVSTSSLGFRGELNPALVGMGDDGGYGGAWVPLAALKKVLRQTLRYLGVLWLFAQFPSILKDVLGRILRENEGALLNHDPEQPALRFFIGGCVFAVSMHRQQLYLQAINVKRYQQQQQQAQSASHQVVTGQGANLSSELSTQEMQEIGEFFGRRVASEPYDASRLASFVTMLTLPVHVLREFLGLIAWKKEALKSNVGSQGTAGEGGAQGQSPRPRVELSLETPVCSKGGEIGSAHEEEGKGNNSTEGPAGSTVAKSSIRHDRQQNLVEFTLTILFDSSQVPHLNVAGGAGWLPQSVALRLRYVYAGEGSRVSLVSMEGSHGGRSCWFRPDNWEWCKERVTRAIEAANAGNVGEAHGRLKSVAESVQLALQSMLVQLGKGTGSGMRQPVWNATAQEGINGGKLQW